MGARGRGGLLRALAMAVALATVTAASAGAATPAPVPCSSIGDGKYDCQFYVAGNGVSAGAPVQASDGSRVGFLNVGTNWVTCQEAGSTVVSGPYENDWWAWTEADNGHWGWVNAVWAKGGANFGSYQSVPACGTAVGLPPGGTAPPKPAPAPPPPPGGSGSGSGTGSTGSGSGTGTGPSGTGSTGSTITPSPAPTPTPTQPARRHLRVAIELDWHVAATQTRVVRVRFLHLPARARIAIACRGPRCHVHQGAMTPRTARRELARAFTGGDVLHVTITHRGYVPEVAVVRFRNGHGPRGAVVAR